MPKALNPGQEAWLSYMARKLGLSGRDEFLSLLVDACSRKNIKIEVSANGERSLRTSTPE